MNQLEQRHHGVWIQKKAPINREYADVSQKVFSDSAAKGFSTPPLCVLSDIIKLGNAAKLKLTEANAAAYEENLDTLFQVDEHRLKLAVEYSKLELAIYKQQILNALELEVAYIEDEFKRDSADIDKLKAQIDLRNVDMIIQKAEIDQEITDYKIQMVEAERSTLGKELELIEAKIETAQVRLTIIDSLRAVIAAEQLIVEAETRRADALEILIGVETEIAAIKESMLPYYQDLADAKSLQADAVRQEAEDKMSIARLQIERAELKITQAEAQADEQEASGRLVLAQRNYDTARAIVGEYRIEAQRLISENQSTNRRTLIDMDEELKKAGIDLGFSTQLEKADITADSRIEKDKARIDAIVDDLEIRLASMRLIAQFQEQRIIASRDTCTQSSTSRQFEQLISG
jgi:hypothetical protein